MNKTIIININGIIFHIEEDAYEILRNYMTDVKRHFLNSADSLEITTDIENRVAEMFSEILTKDNKQVIVEQDVNTVIEQMGRVEDFEEIYEDTKNHAANAYAYNTSERKLFRDPDDHLVGGVCSGIASYFNIEPLWIRLAFALTVFFAGSGLLLYIILWIVIPKAVSRADRMAMKGEKLNLQGFKNHLEEELSSVRNHLNNFHEEARPVIYKLRDFTGDFFTHFGLFIREAVKILVKIAGFILLLIAFGGAIALICFFVAFFAFDAAHNSHLFPLLITENAHSNNIYIAAFITAFIPVVVIIIMLIAGLFKTGGISRTTGTTLLVIWIGALSVFVYYMAKAGTYLREGATFTETINLKTAPNNVYYLKFNDVKYLTHDDSLRLDIKNNFHNATLSSDEDDRDWRNVSIDIEKSDVAQPILVESFTARGRDYEEALLNARNTKYVYVQQDSVLKFDDVLRRTAGGWHQEQLHLTLKVPMNARVVIDQELNDRINMDNANVNDCKNLDKHGDASSAAFIMTNDGLQCKIDTVVTVKTKTQTDSARLDENAKAIAKIQVQLDSAKKADRVKKKK